MTERTRWRNWAGNQVCAPKAIVRPSTEDELVAAVRRAAVEGERVKVVGSGHSFTGTALTDGYLIDLSNYDRLIEVDTSRMQATVQVGKRLEHLNPELWDRGLAMSDLGDIAYQTIAGAFSTGTHGTGIGFGCLATQAVAARVVTGEGDIVECSTERDAELFRAAIVGVGAAGVLSTVTLQLEPAFNLHALEVSMPLGDVLEQQERFVEENEHFEYFCSPHAAVAFTKRNNRTDRPAESLPPWRLWYEDRIVTNIGGNTALWASRVSQRLGSLVRSALPDITREDYVDRSYRVFTSERRVRFYEMEYFIPREHARAALERVRDFIARSGLTISMPIEVRWARGDDLPLSMCYGRDTTSIAIHVRQGEAFEPYFVPVETIMADYEGRPHWGKLHFQTAETLAPLYPAWDEFQSARRRLDPEGRFSNAYTDRVLGPVA